MNAIHSLRSLLLVAALLGIMSISFALPARAHAASTAGYGPNDSYILVKDCPTQRCAGPAAWGPVEQQLHQLFNQGRWGDDGVVASRSNPTRPSWAQWATTHLYYVDEQSPAAQRGALAVLLHDLRGSVVHILHVALAH